MTNTRTAHPFNHRAFQTRDAHALVLLDETESIESQGFRLIRVYRVTPASSPLGRVYKVRAEVRWDTGERQSFAAVSVMNGDLKWTHLASVPTGDWYYTAKESYYSSENLVPADELGWLVTDLVTRAATILA